MTNKEIAILMLEGLIVAMEENSSISVQLSELKTLKILLMVDDNA